MGSKTVQFEIKRQASPDAPAVWEKFELEWRPGMNVVSAMMEIATNPVTADGRPTTPIAYDSNCLEEICGSCAMLINGRARMACSALIDNLEQPIKIEPLSKFPLVRDLQVDRAVLFEPADIVAELDGTGLEVEVAEERERPVDGSDRPAIDAVVRARRPGAATPRPLATEGDGHAA